MCSSIKYVVVLTVNYILKNSYSHSAFLVLKGLFYFGSLGRGVIQILEVEKFIRL